MIVFVRPGTKVPKTLITGATGLIGFHLAKALSAEQHELRLIRRGDALPELWEDLNFESTIADLGDAASLQAAVKGCDRVYHLAAHVSMSKREEDMMRQINVEGTKALVKAAAKEGVKRFVNVSSIAAMGISKSGAATETEAYNHPQGRPYNETKRDAEQAAHEFSGSMQTMSVRPSLVVGPGPFRRGMIASMIKVAMATGLPISPAGGINVVDVEHVVEVLRAAMRLGEDGDRFLAAGHNVGISELMRSICRETGTLAPLLTIPNWLTSPAGSFLQAWSNSGLPGDPPALALKMAGTQMFYDDRWTRARLQLSETRPLAETLRRRIDWEQSKV